MHIPRALLRRFIEARAAAAGQAADSPSNEARELRRLRARLVEAAMPLAAMAVNMVCPNPKPPTTRDDLLSHAREGVLSAVDHYDPSRGARFETYAVSRARWAVLDGLRAADPLPRSARVKLARASASGEKLVAERHGEARGRPPAPSEVARESGIPVATLRELELRALRASPVSLNAPEDPHDPSGRAGYASARLADPSLEDPARALLAAEASGRLLCQVDATLTPRDAGVVRSYFYDGLTLREIAPGLGLTEGRVSQILKASLAALRHRLTTDTFNPSDPDAREAA